MGDIKVTDKVHPSPGLGDKEKTKAKLVLPKSLESRLYLGEMNLETGVGAASAGGTLASPCPQRPDI